MSLDTLYSTQQAAEYLGVSEAHLQRMRSEGGGPSFCRIGKRRVAYRESDLSAWVGGRVATCTEDAHEKGIAAT